MDTWKYHGFPVVRDDGILLGYVPREKLKSFIGSYPILSLQSPMRLSLASFQSLSCLRAAQLLA